MPFSDFTNPYQNPANIPQKYRQHINLRKLFKADGSYVRPAEDPVTMWTLQILVEEYGVPLEAMELELNSDFAEGTYQGGRRYQGRVDIVVYDDRYADSIGNLDVAFIMVEAMEPSKKVGGTEEEGWIDHLNRLNAYMSASPSARYAILTSGKHTVIYRRDLEYPRKLEIIGDLQKYESAREAAKHSFYTVILNPSEPDGIKTGLTPLTRDRFREVLGDTRSGCHSILRDNEGLQPQEAVDAMVKFLFAKWYDEQATIDLVKQTGESRAYVFSVSNETDPERLLVQVRDTFEKAKQWERETLAKKFGDDLGVRLAFNEADVRVIKIRPLPIIDPQYLSAFLNSELGQLQIKQQIKGSSITHIHLEDVRRIKVPLPPRLIQNHIAQIMQDAYVIRSEKLAQAEYINLYNKNIVLERLKISWDEIKNTKYFCVSIKELLSSRFDISYQSLRAKNALLLLNKSGYDVKCLGNLIEEIHYGASVKNDYADDGIPFIRVGNLKPNYIDISNIVYFDESKRNLLGKAFVKPEDLLMSRSGSVGIVAVVPPEANGFAFGSFQIKFTLRKGLANPFFIAYFLNSAIGNAQVEQQKTGSIQMNITIEGIKALKVPLPAIEIQNKIVKEADEQRTQANFLRDEAEGTILTAKARIERMILGEEEVT
jgi:Type I restriction modification DNA specificity domain/Type I restriction enzyme R protein N terminus (HSDR_N)